MKDMHAHTAKLRDQAAEAAMMSGEAETVDKREFFVDLCTHLALLADQTERALVGAAKPSDTFLGRKTHEPFPKGEE